MRRLMLLALVVLLLALALPASAHTKAASHDGCKVKHGLTYDGYSGGKYWYHTMTYVTLPFSNEQAMKHYYRGGPPSNPVYYYVNTTYWLCF